VCLSSVVSLLLESSFFGRVRSSLGMIPACSFYSLKEVQGYKILACGVTLAGGGA
jgi:hypothetical protein